MIYTSTRNFSSRAIRVLRNTRPIARSHCSPGGAVCLRRLAYTAHQWAPGVPARSFFGLGAPRGTQKLTHSHQERRLLKYVKQQRGEEARRRTLLHAHPPAPLFMRRATPLTHRYPRALLYHVVSNVAEYHKFVPWCVESRVLAHSDQDMRAELAVGFQLFTERYTSRVHMVPGVLVEATASNTHLFERLVNAWAFEDGPQPDTTWVDFKVEFAFRSRMYAQAAGLFKTEVVLRMISAFEQRCQFLLDHKLWPPPGADLAEAEQASLHPELAVGAAPSAPSAPSAATSATTGARHGIAGGKLVPGLPPSQQQVSRARPSGAPGRAKPAKPLSIPVALRMPPPIPTVHPLDTAGKLAKDVWENTLGRRPATRYTSPDMRPSAGIIDASSPAQPRKVVAAPPLPTKGLW